MNHLLGRMLADDSYEMSSLIFSETKKSSAAAVFHYLTLLLLNMTCPVLANSADPDQLASEEAN